MLEGILSSSAKDVVSTYGSMAYLENVDYTNVTNISIKLNDVLYNSLNTYKVYINTIFDGANDAGYYFDYNKDNTDIIVKSILNDPIDNSLQGSGTEEEPYLIYNVNDMNKLSKQIITEGKYYRVMNDIDYNNSEYYMIGTSTHPFKGTFDGNGYTLSNITINGYDYTAMFGYNEGIIRGLNIENITVTGNNYVAGVAASNKGEVSMINLTGNITGNSYVGGIVSEGRTSTNATVKDVIVNANVTATISNAGGLVYHSANTYGAI